MSYMDCHFPSNIGVIAAACRDLQIAFTVSSAFITSEEMKEISLDDSSSDRVKVFTLLQSWSGVTVSVSDNVMCGC